jgi:hypothetical protein
MHYLYGIARDGARKLVATFDSQQQALAYVRWATLHKPADGPVKFEQGSPLVGFVDAQVESAPLTSEDPDAVVHNPSPSML